MEKIKNNRFILNKSEIDDIAFDFLINIGTDLISTPQPIPIEEIIESKLKLNLDFQCIDESGAILGLTTFSKGYLKVFNREKRQKESIFVSEGTIIIDNDLAEDKYQEGRFRFTCAHEVSHWHLHRFKFAKLDNQPGLELVFEYSEPQAVKCLNRNIENMFVRNGLKTEEDWMEWQADYLAGSLLMPKKSFVNASSDLIKGFGVPEGILIKGEKPIIENHLLNELSSVYNVSKKAVEIRLGQLSIVKKVSSQMALL